MRRGGAYLKHNVFDVRRATGSAKDDAAVVRRRGAQVKVCSGTMLRLHLNAEAALG